MQRNALSLGIGRLFAGLLAVVMTPTALAGPNLVANGDLNRPAKQAEMHVNLLKGGVYFAFSGADHFGRVIVTGTDDYRAYRKTHPRPAD